MKLKQTFLLLPLVLAAGCVSSPQQDYGDVGASAFNKVVGNWIGHSHDKLLVAWGVPRDEALLSDGKKLLQYEGQADLPVGKDRYQRMTCEVSVMLGKDGMVSAVRGKGSGCVDQSPMMQHFPKP
ncbi:hypothetical protein [Aestuariispira insulae]|uniref:Lipoprotein n=1 Tax=Aestuariispira insulae TaxID=1461337 RepID=A0A3D9HS09_9PROT|nr:hypothetical protein [Aestuariispira insulae]RED52282.1 hypothetical protein DFP90_102301 [Aestuariispira insulae]